VVAFCLNAVNWKSFKEPKTSIVQNTFSQTLTGNALFLPLPWTKGSNFSPQINCHLCLNQVAAALRRREALLRKSCVAPFLEKLQQIQGMRENAQVFMKVIHRVRDVIGQLAKFGGVPLNKKTFSYLGIMNKLEITFCFVIHSRLFFMLQVQYELYEVSDCWCKILKVKKWSCERSLKTTFLFYAAIRLHDSSCFVPVYLQCNSTEVPNYAAGKNYSFPYRNLAAPQRCFVVTKAIEKHERFNSSFAFYNYL